MTYIYSWIYSWLIFSLFLFFWLGVFLKWKWVHFQHTEHKTKTRSRRKIAQNKTDFLPERFKNLLFSIAFFHSLFLLPWIFIRFFLLFFFFCFFLINFSKWQFLVVFSFVSVDFRILNNNKTLYYNKLTAPNSRALNENKQQ